MSRKLVTCMAVAAVAVATILLFRPGRTDITATRKDVVDVKKVPQASVKKVRTAKRTASVANAKGSQPPNAASRPSANDDGLNLSPADEKTMDEIQSALDDESLDAIRKLAAMALSSSTAEVRQKAVDALGWFGKDALAELLPFLADADEDVRSSAMGAVEHALSQVENEGMKARYIEMLVNVNGACSEDGLAMLSGQLNGLSDSSLAVATAVRIIQANPGEAAVEEMKEVYQFHTNEDYTTPEAAEKWLATERQTIEGR